jgi:transcriptional regulator with XRE-family HTH domain
MRDRISEQIAEAAVALLTAVRKKKGLSHQFVADASGLNRSAISMIESGKRSPTLKTCLKIARALDVDLADLIKKAQKAT